MSSAVASIRRDLDRAIIGGEGKDPVSQAALTRSQPMRRIRLAARTGVLARKPLRQWREKMDNEQGSRYIRALFLQLYPFSSSILYHSPIFIS